MSNCRKNNRINLDGQTGQCKKFSPPQKNPGGNLGERTNIGPGMSHLEGRNVGTGMDHQWKVIVGGVSNKGRKIATGKIDLLVMIKKTPLRRETGERVNLKNYGADCGSRSNRNTKRWRDSRRWFGCVRIHGQRRDSR
jgi:hypothetical protein